MIKTPVFNELVFNSEPDFKKWLQSLTYKSISLKDLGQDVQMIYVHDNGEILHSDFQSELFRGRFINLDALEETKNLEFWDENNGIYIPYSSLVIENIFNYRALKYSTKHAIPYNASNYSKFHLALRGYFIFQKNELGVMVKKNKVGLYHAYPDYQLHPERLLNDKRFVISKNEEYVQEFE